MRVAVAIPKMIFQRTDDPKSGCVIDLECNEIVFPDFQK